VLGPGWFQVQVSVAWVLLLAVGASWLFVAPLCGPRLRCFSVWLLTTAVRGAARKLSFDVILVVRLYPNHQIT